MKGNTNKFMKIHEITPKDYTDLHRLYCQLEDDWTSDIQDMIRVLEEVKDDPHYHLVGILTMQTSWWEPLPSANVLI